jgi:YD repeat-containing protein
VTARSDEHGRVSTTTYGLLGRVVSNTDFDGNTTIDQYDAVGNLLESTTTVNGLSSTVQYTYDSANRLSTLTGAAATVGYS